MSVCELGARSEQAEDSGSREANSTTACTGDSNPSADVATSVSSCDIITNNSDSSTSSNSHSNSSSNSNVLVKIRRKKIKERKVKNENKEEREQGKDGWSEIMNSVCYLVPSLTLQSAGTADPEAKRTQSPGT